MSPSSKTWVDSTCASGKPRWTFCEHDVDEPIVTMNVANAVGHEFGVDAAERPPRRIAVDQRLHHVALSDLR